MRIFVQIGTNNGNDSFRSHVYKEKPDMVVLIEPNSIHLESIKYFYQNVPNVHIINKCIYEKDNETISLYIPASNGILGTKGTNGIAYGDGNYSVVPMNDWGEKKDMHEIKAQSIRFDTLCEQLNITDIEYLQIDTEGYDSEIIRMIDLNKINIKVLRYEKWYFDPSCFTKYNADKELGKKGMDFVTEKLKNHGYDLFDINEPNNNNDTIAIKKHALLKN